MSTNLTQTKLGKKEVDKEGPKMTAKVPSKEREETRVHSGSSCMGKQEEITGHNLSQENEDVELEGKKVAGRPLKLRDCPKHSCALQDVESRDRSEGTEQKIPQESEDSQQKRVCFSGAGTSGV